MTDQSGFFDWAQDSNRAQTDWTAKPKQQEDWTAKPKQEEDWSARPKQQEDWIAKPILDKTIEALADFQVLKKIICPDSNILTSDLLVYVMINETDVYAVFAYQKKFLHGISKYFSSLITNQKTSIFRSTKHPALGIDISYLKIPDSKPEDVVACLAWLQQVEQIHTNVLFCTEFYKGSIRTKSCQDLIEYYKIFNFLLVRKFVKMTEKALEKRICSKNVFELVSFQPLTKACKKYVGDLELRCKQNRVRPLDIIRFDKEGRRILSSTVSLFN